MRTMKTLSDVLNKEPIGTNLIMPGMRVCFKRGDGWYAHSFVGGMVPVPLASIINVLDQVRRPWTLM